VKSKPANNAAITPEAKLGGENAGLRNNPIIPPRNVDVAPRYEPSMMPITGAIIVAAVMVLPKKPSIGNMGKKERTTYKAVKHAVRATSLAASFLVVGIL